MAFNSVQYAVLLVVVFGLYRVMKRREQNPIFIGLFKKGVSVSGLIRAAGYRPPRHGQQGSHFGDMYQINLAGTSEFSARLGADCARVVLPAGDSRCGSWPIGPELAERP